MKDFIEVPIVCNNEQTYELKKLEVKINPCDYDVRKGYIRYTHIIGFIPTPNATTIVYMTDDYFEIALSIEEFKNRIESQNK